MSTYSERDFTPILAAASAWAQQCLVQDGGILGGGAVWTAQNFADLDRYFVNQPDAGSGDFYQKLEGQMANAPSGAPKLMAELLWVLFLFPSNMGPRSKRSGVEQAWNMSGERLDPDHPMLSNGVLAGIGSAGTAFNTMRWREVNYAISLFTAIKQMPTEDRATLVGDYDRLTDWLETMPRDGDRQFRHMLRYLLCPDRVERMSSNGDRRRVLAAFRVATARDMTPWTDRQFDDAMLALRRRLEAELKTQEIDFYLPPLVDQWRGSELSKGEPTAFTTFDLGYAELRERFLEQFPRFNSFRVEAIYVENERRYKDELVQLFEQDVSPLLAKADWPGAGDSAIDLLTRPLKHASNKPQNIVGWRYVDVLRKLGPEQRATFGQLLNELIDPAAPIEDRVDRFVSELGRLVGDGQRVLPAAQRSIVGFYLTLADPQQFLFLKTAELQRALRKLDHEFSWSSGWLTGKDVSRVKSLATRVFERLEAEQWKPKDFLDVQGFLWVATAYGSAKVEDGGDENEDAESTPEGRLAANRVPRNQILFGPPGTGKTFHLQQLLKSRYTEAAATVDPAAWRSEQIATHIVTLTWWEALGAALYELGGSATVPQLSKHPYIVAVASSKGRTKAVNQTLWGVLQQHALVESNTVNITLKLAPFVFDKSEESVWRLAGPWKDYLSDVIELVDEIKQGPMPAGEPVRRYAFVTFHQSFSYEDFMEGLTPIADEETGSIRYEIKKGVFLRLCERARLDPDHFYAMVIDEINRGNVSKLFGELITLIEVDKRAGAEHAVSLTLPYSGETFSVPSNVDLIATMNTADRSLMGLDIALRRRFEFLEMPAKPELLAGVDVEGIDIEAMLTVMNQRIEVLLDRDHHLGHAYFMPLIADPSLKRLGAIFRNQILPLLQEYFFEDWERIRWVLNDQHKKGAGHCFVVPPQHSVPGLFGGTSEVPVDARLWELDPTALGRRESYLGIIDAGVIGSNGG